MGEELRKKRKREMPNTMVILVGCMAVMALLTYLLPAGAYDRVVNEAGSTVIDPSSYHHITRTPVSLMGFLRSIPTAFEDTAQIIAMTFFSSGAIMILRKIGVIDSAMESLAKKFEGRGTMAIPILMFVFALIDSIIGTPELCIVYVPIILPLMFRLGFDSITGVATVILGSAAGFSAALTNPFTIAIGQKLCDLPLYSGWQFRIVTFLVTYLIGAVYVVRYGKSVLKTPECSRMYQEDLSEKARMLRNQGVAGNMTVRQKLAGIYTVVLFVGMILGLIVLKWDMPEMTACFLAIAIGAGVMGRLSAGEICDGIVEGFKDVVVGVILIILARAAYVIMAEGNIVDTIIYYLAQFLVNLPAQMTVIGVLAIVTLLNFVIASGSGKAVMLFPILAPLADICGITRQTAVLSYQFGDGFTNVFWPTSGVLGAVLGIAGFPGTSGRDFSSLCCVCGGVPRSYSY